MIRGRQHDAHAEKQHARDPGDLLGVWVARSRPVREGQVRTTDVYAREKSDRVVVPFNRPNKEAPYSAEEGEGRPRTEENIVRIPHDPDSERALRDAGVVRCAVRRVYRYSSEVGAVCSIRTYGSARGCALKAHEV